jgi:uncharacterized protein YndB with AHSA1/START domain
MPEATAVFRAWTNPETLRRWWCPAGWTPAEIEVDLRAGGAYCLGMRRVENGETVYVRGRFLEVCVPQKLVHPWKWENAFDQVPETQVTVRFIELPPHPNRVAGGVATSERSALERITA